MTTASSNPPIVEQPLPSAGIRSVVTYLLFLHFFFLVIGIKSRTDSSGLEQDLRNKVPGLKPYLQLLGMDLSYMFHLTYYDPSPQSTYPLTDTDFYVEADVPRADGTTETIRFPSTEELSGIRFQRLERLAHVIGMEGEAENESATLLAQGIAKRLIIESKSVDVVRQKPMRVRVRRRILPNLMLPPEELQRTGVLMADRNGPNYFETVYEFDAVLTSDNEVAITKIGAASNAAAPQQTAPTRSAPSGASGATPPAGALQPRPSPAAPAQGSRP